MLVSGVQFEGATQGDDRPDGGRQRSTSGRSTTSTTHRTARSTEFSWDLVAEQRPRNGRRAGGGIGPARPAVRAASTTSPAPRARSTRPASPATAVRKALHADAELLSTSQTIPRQRATARRGAAGARDARPPVRARPPRRRRRRGPGTRRTGSRRRSSSSASPPRRTACSAAPSVSSRTTICWSRPTSPARAARTTWRASTGLRRRSPNLTVRRPVAAALDVATGCGIQALLDGAARRARRRDRRERARARLRGVQRCAERHRERRVPRRQLLRAGGGRALRARRLQPAVRHLARDRARLPRQRSPRATR